jgi:hypothetical protein
MKQTYPYLLLDLSGIADPADFVHKKLQFFLMREGGQSTELAARKIYQIWTPKRL